MLGRRGVESTKTEGFIKHIPIPESKKPDCTCKSFPLNQPVSPRHVCITTHPKRRRDLSALFQIRKHKTRLSLSLSLLSILFLPLVSSAILPKSDSLIFMNSRATEASVFPCQSGNKNSLFFTWILFCLWPKFLGTPFAFVNFLLVKAIDRSPSGALVLATFG
ncbi:hypothetical protein ACLB2K_065165 [Fragaria x ananassa]